MFMPPGNPIILIKSNLFNMAAVSVKWSIEKTWERGTWEHGKGMDSIASSSPFMLKPAKDPFLHKSSRPLLAWLSSDRGYSFSV